MGAEEELNGRTNDSVKWYSKQGIKKWGLAGMLVPFIPFALTQMDKYFEERSYLQTLRALTEAQPVILRVIRDEVHAGLRDHRIEEDSVSNETKVATYAKVVLVQSIDKVAFIVNELEKCTRDTKCVTMSEFDRNQLMKRIRVELYRQSAVYITHLNSMAEHPVIGKVGDFVARTFPMEGDTELMRGNFMKDLEEIIFMHNVTPHKKGEALMNYMKGIQQQYFALVLIEMRKRY